MRIARAGQFLCIVIPVAIWFAPLDLNPVAKHALAIAMFVIIAWTTHAMEFALAGLIGCFLFWATGVVGFSEAFSGFANSTPWYLFGALVIGSVATQSGLARRLAYSVILRARKTYPGILLGIIVADFCLTFIVPSGIARIVILAVIARGLIDAFHAEPASNVARGMFLVLTYTASIFDKMMIAGAGTITARGLMQTAGGVEVPWSLWLIAFLPASVLTILAAWRLTLWLYPPEAVAIESGIERLREESQKLASPSSIEKRAMVLVFAIIALLMTEPLHHVSTAAIFLGAALIAFLPQVGVLQAEELKRFDFSPVLFVATAVSMGSVLGATKAVDILTSAMFSWMQPFVTSELTGAAVMYWPAVIFHVFLASTVSMVSVTIPPLMAFAKSHGLDPLQLGMIWTFAAGGKLFVYQSGVLIVGYSYGYFSAGDLFRLGWWLTVVEFPILLFLVGIYWPLIGIA